MTRKRLLGAVAAGAVLLVAATLAHALFVAPFRVTTTELVVPVRGLAPGFEGYTILHLSDFETDRPGPREIQVKAIATDLEPDAILVTGDLVSKDLEGEAYADVIEQMASWLGSLVSRDGTFFVEGHGESRSNDDELAALFEKHGIVWLKDSLVVIDRGGDRLTLAGVRVRDYGAEGEWVSNEDSIRHGPGFLPHYLEYRSDSPDQGDHEFTGRFRFSNSEDRVGFLLNSHFGAGSNRFYVIARRPPVSFLTAAVRGGVFDEGEISRTASISAGVWHRFRTAIHVKPDKVSIMARTWHDGTPEPDEWDIIYSDGASSRIVDGVVGLYVEGPGIKEFAELDVVSEPGGEWIEPDGNGPLLDLLDEAPEGVPLILASHTPDILPDAEELNIPLVLAGHTHGGQVRLPFIGALTTDTRLGREYAEGLSAYGRSTVFVTRGVGTSRLPLRLFAPPEAAVLRLTAGRGPD